MRPPPSMGGDLLASMAQNTQLLPGLVVSEPTNTLLMLLCFLAPSVQVSLHHLHLGTASRKRWDTRGEMEEVEAVRAGLSPELLRLLDTPSVLATSLEELCRVNVVGKVPGNSDMYALNEVLRARIRDSLPLDLQTYLRSQALLLTYRAVPWKYLEPKLRDAYLIQAQLKHTIEQYGRDASDLPVSSRTDIGLTLIESTRFPTLQWKRYATDQAKFFAQGIDDPYLWSRIAHSESLIGRLQRRMDIAAGALNRVRVNQIPSTEKRLRAVQGFTAIQVSLNCIQVEDLAGAKKALTGWSPTSSADASTMEDIINFRRNMLRGRALRLSGGFNEALAAFKRSQAIVNQRSGTNFDEDMGDLACEIADTLRELDNLQAAEKLLRGELTRREQFNSPDIRKSNVDLALAEVLFAQGRAQEAEHLCHECQNRPNILRFDRVRLYITLAKLHHGDPDTETPLAYWSRALESVSKFPEESWVTRIIVRSVCDILKRRTGGHQDVLHQSQQQLITLTKLIKPDGIRCWVAGLRHWQDYLEKKQEIEGTTENKNPN